MECVYFRLCVGTPPSSCCKVADNYHSIHSLWLIMLVKSVNNLAYLCFACFLDISVDFPV